MYVRIYDLVRFRRECEVCEVQSNECEARSEWPVQAIRIGGKGMSQPGENVGYGYNRYIEHSDD